MVCYTAAVTDVLPNPVTDVLPNSNLGKEYVKAGYCHPAYLTSMQGNTGLDETQAGIKIARRNVSNFRYADDTTLMAESEEELKSLLMKVRGQ